MINENRVMVRGWILFTLGVFLLVAVLSPFIASERPILYRSDNRTFWPLFSNDRSSDNDWKRVEGRVLFTLIPFSPTKTNLTKRYLPPLSTEVIRNRTYRHWLGTDRLGRDVAAGMVHGCTKSLWVGILAMSLAAVLGLIFGALAGFYGNREMKMNGWQILFIALATSYITYLGYYRIISIATAVISIILVGGLAAVAVLTGFGKGGSGRRASTIPLPIDVALLRSTEIIATLPALLLLMVIGAVIDTPSLSLLAILIACLRWPRFALFVRSEVQKLKMENYVAAARVSGLSDFVILRKLILPKTLVSISVLFAFGVASTIMLESTLSFLGIGVPLDAVTWGSILGQSRENIGAWWLAIFPGIAIASIIFLFNHLGEYLRLAKRT